MSLHLLDWLIRGGWRILGERDCGHSDLTSKLLGLDIFYSILLLVAKRGTFVLWHFHVCCLHKDPKQCCDNTKLNCPNLFSFHPTMLWHHTTSLYSFNLLLYNNVVAPQSFIVFIWFITIQQCCGTTKLHCPQYFLPIQQCCDTTKLHCPHSFSSHPTVL